jgi:hypothetical protein
MAEARLQGYSICGDVTFEITEDGVLASNHRARQHVLLNLPLFNLLAGAESDANELHAWDCTTISNLEGLLADPTCLIRNTLGEPSPRHPGACRVPPCLLRFAVASTIDTNSNFDRLSAYSRISLERFGSDDPDRHRIG